MAETGTLVTCKDIVSGETESVVVCDDYVLVTDGRMRLDHVQVYGNGTVQLTLKRDPE